MAATKLLQSLLVVALATAATIAPAMGHGLENPTENLLAGELPCRLPEAGSHDHGAGHTHYMPGPDEPLPELSIEVLPDPKMGFNLHINTENFEFAPSEASTEHVPGHGHAHWFLDGVKQGRVYTPWFYIGGLSPGEHTIAVGLATNAHQDYMVAGELVRDAATIIVPEPSMGGGHSHMTREADLDTSVDLNIHLDHMKGYNLNIRVEGFTFTPENASTAPIDGQGHGHLYVDGVKITRVYGEWYYLGALAPGQHEVTVTLNGNDHVDLVHGDEPIAATQTILVNEVTECVLPALPSADGHQH